MRPLRDWPATKGSRGSLRSRHYIGEIDRYVGGEAHIKGWLSGRRSSGKILFLQIRDGTGFMQCVASRGALGDAMFETLDALPIESSLSLTGTVTRDERAPGGYELSVSSAEVVGVAEEYPISRKEHGVSFLMDHRHLWIRSSRQFAALRIRATVVAAARNYFDSRGYLQLDTPILTPTACEGTTTLFETSYFDEKAYLSQSGQLYNEATAMAFGKVYCFGPSFRAEKSKTRRHLIEFWQIEPEVAYADLDDIMDIEEEMVSEIVSTVLEKRTRELELLERDVEPLKRVRPPFPRVTYTEAVERLNKAGHPFEWGGDLGAEDETVLSRQFDRPVMVTRYPRSVKPFYMENDPDDPKVTLSVDMLAPEGYGEIIGGGQRMMDAATLEARMREEGIPVEDYQWYLDLRRYGTVPHGGFGMGIERFVAWVCGLSHIRETIPFPRMLYRMKP
ncbi:MAG: asparagine--tRNA ligase [Candidatus Eisenbacteria bacterium]|nr:asparagine--tRNA ligase [Candidatus Eisenbacteria bacterium]